VQVSVTVSVPVAPGRVVDRPTEVVLMIVVPETTVTELAGSVTVCAGWVTVVTEPGRLVTTV
jgi:hypothetical protein